MGLGSSQNISCTIYFCDPHSQRLWHRQESRSRCFSETLLLFRWSIIMDVGNLTSGSSAFSKTRLNIRKFTVHILLKPGLENFEQYFTSVWDECNCAVVWAFFGIAFLWDWNENWLWRRLSAKELMLLNCGVGEVSWESLGLQGDPTSPFWRRSAPGFLWKEWCWSWNSSTLATSCEELIHWKRPWGWEGLGAGGEGDERGWDGWMASLTRWTWV